MNISDIWQFPLINGSSDSPQNGACLLDAVSWFEYGHLGDHPECVCPVIAMFGRGVNDVMRNEGRQRLRAFIPRLVGTVDKGSELERSDYLAWQAICVFAPFSLEAVGLKEEAEMLRNLHGTFSAVDREATVKAILASIYPAHQANTYCAKKAKGLVSDGASKAAAMVAVAASKAASTAFLSAMATDTAARAARVTQVASARYTETAKLADGAAAAAWDAMCISINGDLFDLAKTTKIEDMIIDAMNGVLAIGRQAEPIPVERMKEAQRTFELAAAEQT